MNPCGIPRQETCGFTAQGKAFLGLGEGPELMAQSLVTYKSLPFVLLEEFLPLGMLSHSFLSEEAKSRAREEHMIKACNL